MTYIAAGETLTLPTDNVDKKFHEQSGPVQLTVELSTGSVQIHQINSSSAWAAQANMTITTAGMHTLDPIGNCAPIRIVPTGDAKVSVSYRR